MTAYRIHPTPIGSLGLAACNGALVRVWLPNECQHLDPPRVPASDALTDSTENERVLSLAIQELDAYFSGSQTRFTVPIQLAGTRFQRAVWHGLAAIPYGRTRTYGEIAAQLKNPLAARAVGRACGQNPVAVFIPCHRVVAATGIGGFRGGSPIKTALLAHEQTVSLGTRGSALAPTHP